MSVQRCEYNSIANGLSLDLFWCERVLGDEDERDYVDLPSFGDAVRICQAHLDGVVGSRDSDNTCWEPLNKDAVTVAYVNVYYVWG